MTTNNIMQNSSSAFRKNSLPHSLLRVCYFGIYNPDFSRNKIYIQGLEAIGVNVLQCQDISPGILKYLRLFRKHQKLRGRYDAVIVGYPGHIVVPFARLLSRKPVIADLLGSLEDAEIHSHYPTFWKRVKAKVADVLAVNFADVVLLESEAQKKFFIEKFGRSDKYQVVYTGAGDHFDTKNEIREQGEHLYQEHSPDERNTKKGNTEFKVLFRGRLTPESGIGHILETAEILKKYTNISFLILGGGQLLSFVEQSIKNKNLHNVQLISKFLSDEELVEVSTRVDISLGQMEDNPRLNRTIPHKAFEAFVLGVPYVTGDAPAISELVKEGETGFLVPLAHSEKLAEKILYLSNQPELLDKVSVHEKEMFQTKLSSCILAQQIIKIISDFCI